MVIPNLKSEKLREEDRLVNFKPGLWQTGFFRSNDTFRRN